MSKILKNTTVNDIDLTRAGLRIPASSQVTLDVKDYIQLATAESVTELTSLINSGDIVVNDGLNDLSSTQGLEYIKYPNFADSVRFLDDAQNSNNITARTVQAAIEEVNTLSRNHASRHLPDGADPLNTATAVTLTATTTNSIGNANSFARSDHTHLIQTGVVSTQTPDQSNAAGSSANIARADHIHNIPTAQPLATFTSNVQGTAGSFARSDHRHNTELLNYTERRTGEVQTNSSNDVQLQDMLITPAAGTYIYMAGASFKHFNSSRTVYFSIYKNSSQESNTLSEFTTGLSVQTRDTQQMWSITGQITMNGTDSIGIRWRSSKGTARVFLRYLTLIRVG